MARDPKTHYEHPDPKPLAIPAGFRRPPTLAEQVARLVRNENFRRQVEAEGFESFEEADDFDIEDDPVDPGTPYETFFDPALGRDITPADVLRHESAYRAETENRQNARKALKEASEKKKAAAATPPAAARAAAPPEPKEPGS